MSVEELFVGSVIAGLLLSALIIKALHRVDKSKEAVLKMNTLKVFKCTFLDGLYWCECKESQLLKSLHEHPLREARFFDAKGHALWIQGEGWTLTEFVDVETGLRLDVPCAYTGIKAIPSRQDITNFKTPLSLSYRESEELERSLYKIRGASIKAESKLYLEGERDGLKRKVSL